MNTTPHTKVADSGRIGTRDPQLGVPCCQVFAVVGDAGTIVMQDGEELDSWSVIVNGRVEISGPGLPTTELGLGDRWVPSGVSFRNACPMCLLARPVLGIVIEVLIPRARRRAQIGSAGLFASPELRQAGRMLAPVMTSPY